MWVVGVWPRPRSMHRALRCDGVIPQYALAGRDGGPDDAAAVRSWLTGEGMGPGFDVIAEGQTPAAQPGTAEATAAAWARAGCTWWLETRWGTPDDLPDRIATIRERIAAGPPRAG